jgi:serine/threonine-protein kinase
MLRRETLVTAEVNCSHLASVVANEPSEAAPHIVLPYLEGIALRRLTRWCVERDVVKPVSVGLVLSIARQIAAALAAMHEVGWLHGQVRPEHVIVSPWGHATLIDLTQARRLESAECAAGDDFIGSRVYAAPEIFSTGRRLTTAADVYSLGILLFEALVGQPPFVGHSPREIAARHRSERPPDLRQWRPDASKEVSELVWRMLAKEPLRRPSAEQLVRWLAELEIAELASNPSLTLRVGV